MTLQWRNKFLPSSARQWKEEGRDKKITFQNSKQWMFLFFSTVVLFFMAMLAVIGLLSFVVMISKSILNFNISHQWRIKSPTPLLVVERVIQAVPDGLQVDQSRRIQETKTLLSSEDGSDGQIQYEYLVFNSTERRSYLVHHGHSCLDDSWSFMSSRVKDSLSVLDVYDMLGQLLDQAQQEGQKRYGQQEDEPVMGTNHEIIQNLENNNPELLLQSKSFSSEDMNSIQSLQIELWKFCALSSGFASMYLDYDQTIHALQPLSHIFPDVQVNYLLHHSVGRDASSLPFSPKGVIDEEYLAQTSILVLGRNSEGKQVARDLLKWLIQTIHSVLQSSQQVTSYRDILLQQSAKLQSIADLSSNGSNKWEWLEIKCTGTLSFKTSILSSYQCARDRDSPCCQVRRKHDSNRANTIDEQKSETLLLLQNPLPLGETVNAGNDINHDHNIETATKQHSLTSSNFISTIHPESNSQTGDHSPKNECRIAPRFFDMLVQNDCLPKNDKCLKCLQRYQPEDNPTAKCQLCESSCGCYCRTLCTIRPTPIQPAKVFHVTPPSLRKNDDRLIPKIVHQTWFEEVTTTSRMMEKYPHMSKLVNSWKESGWEYSFYDDGMSIEFLRKHFPKEVLEAYESILPGAFKADLFRYCLLLIHGGVYADMDTLLNADLDKAIPADVGFMTGIDEPGIIEGHQYCLWNGFLAVAPAHPFIAKTIEMVVNNIRNRFTAMDIDDMLCPNPVLSVSHGFDLLHVTGPCIFGAAVNSILGKHKQSNLGIGDINIWERDVEGVIDMKNIHSEQMLQVGDRRKGTDPRWLIPGRSILLKQDKEDMGSHRFTFVEKNMIVVSTDLPNSDDPQQNQSKEKKHYSSTRDVRRLYGVKGLYIDDRNANEELRFIIEF